MDNTRHIIERVNVEVDVPDMATANYIRDNVGDFLNGEVFPRLEHILSKFSNEQHLRADSISIDLVFNTRSDFEEQFTSRLLGRLGNVIAKELESSTIQSEDADQVKFERNTAVNKHWQIFLHFLQTGSYPWYASIDDSWLDEKDILSAIEEEGIGWKTTFFQLLQTDSVTFHRLILQFSSQFVAELINKYLGWHVKWPVPTVKSYAATIGDDSGVVRVFFLAVLKYLSEFSNESVVEQDIDAILVRTEENILENSTTYAAVPEVLSPLQKREGLVSKKEKDAVDGIYIRHAGLVLLHPFLQYFFKEFDLFVDAQFKDKTAQQTAVHLLHYLATGGEQAVEADQIMEKYLCGMYVYEPMDRFIALSDEMKKECTQVLEAVVKHWKVLKNTSPDGLREAFLNRNGKLNLGGDREHLMVEGSALDILLDQLPWNYAMISLPWLKKLLYVDWH